MCAARSYSHVLLNPLRVSSLEQSCRHVCAVDAANIPYFELVVILRNITVYVRTLRGGGIARCIVNYVRIQLSPWAFGLLVLMRREMTRYAEEERESYVRV